MTLEEINTTRYMIEDWTGKACFDGRTFSSFDEAWAFIYEADPMPLNPTEDQEAHWFDDYYAVPSV